MVRFFADFHSTLHNSAPGPASGGGVEFHKSLAAAAIALSVLLILVIRLYRLGYYSGQQQEHYLVVDPTSRNPRIIAKQYGDRTIEGFFDAKTLELTGEWRMTTYSDANPIDATYEELGQLKRKNDPSLQPLDAIYRDLKSLWVEWYSGS